MPELLAAAISARDLGRRPLTVLGATRIMSAAERKQARLSESQARELLKARHDMLVETAATDAQ